MNRKVKQLEKNRLKEIYNNLFCDIESLFFNKKN